MTGPRAGPVVVVGRIVRRMREEFGPARRGVARAPHARRRGTASPHSRPPAVKEPCAAADLVRMAFDLNFCLRHLIESGGSDLHLKVPAPPVMRVDGDMRRIEGLPGLTREDTDNAVREMLGDPRKLEEF